MNVSRDEKRYEYKGIWPVMITPFDDRGEIDYDCYIALLDWYLSSGIDGIFAVCGSSEMFELSDSERLRLAELTVKHCSGRVPVVATGSFGCDFESHKRFSIRLAEAGVDAVILLLPDFCKDESETVEYLLKMAELLPCDVGIYECPGVGIGSLSVESVERLACTNRFGPYKETSCEVEIISAKARVCSESSMSILQANSPLMLEALEAGADGLMGIAVNVVPSLAVDIYREFQSGRLAERSHELLCLVDALLRLCYPVSAKIMLAQLGFDISERTRMSNKFVSSEIRKLIVSGFSYIANQISSAVPNS